MVLLGSPSPSPHAVSFVIIATFSGSYKSPFSFMSFKFQTEQAFSAMGKSPRSVAFLERKTCKSSLFQWRNWKFRTLDCLLYLHPQMHKCSTNKDLLICWGFFDAYIHCDFPCLVQGWELDWQREHWCNCLLLPSGRTYSFLRGTSLTEEIIIGHDIY